MSIIVRDLDPATLNRIDAAAGQLRLSRQQYLYQILSDLFSEKNTGTAKTASRLRAAFGGLEPDLFSASSLARDCGLPDPSLIEQTLAGHVPLSFQLIRQLSDLVGINETWLYDNKNTPFYKPPQYQSPAGLISHIATHRLFTRNQHLATSLFFLLSHHHTHPSVSVFAHAQSNPRNYDLLLDNVPFHTDVGSTGAQSIFELILLLALLNSPDLQAFHHKYQVWGRIYEPKQYNQIVNGDVHPSTITAPSAYSSYWTDDIWDLQHPQRAYTQTYLDVFKLFQNQLKEKNITHNADLVLYIEAKILKLQQPA